MNPEDQSANTISAQPPFHEPHWYSLLAAWFFQTLAFVLLPLVVYGITLAVLGVTIQQFMRLPEFSFITIVLLGDTTRKWISYSQKKEEFPRVLSLASSLTVAGITITSILLCLLIIAQYRADFQLPREITAMQTFMFVFAMCLSAITSIFFKIDT
jgi:hypothetical protein